MEMTEDNLFDVKALLERAGVISGSTVVDCGAGRAAPITLAAADIVGEHGTVYALDVVKDALAAVEHRMQSTGHMNVTTVWTDLEIVGAAKRVANDSADVVVLSDVLFQSQKRASILREAARMARPGGKIVVVDWKPVAENFGPPKEQRVTPEEIKDIGASLKLQPVDEHEPGDHHWAIIFQK